MYLAFIPIVLEIRITNFKKINFREHPELYRIGRGEQGVLLVEPYKSENLPSGNLLMKKPSKADTKIWQLFEEYLGAEDFVGADMARKFLQ